MNFLLIQAALADGIDFESIPGTAAPAEGMVIHEQFRDSHGVTFSLADGTAPVLAEVGPPVTAFSGPPNNRSPDTPLPDQGVGRFFLTDDGRIGGLSSPALIVTLDAPIHRASGVLLDVDYDEVFLIELRGEGGEALDHIAVWAGDEGTGDGLATPWLFVRDSPDVHSIVFQGSRRASGYFGLGFDNFFPGGGEPLSDAQQPGPAR